MCGRGKKGWNCLHRVDWMLSAIGNRLPICVIKKGKDNSFNFASEVMFLGKNHTWIGNGICTLIFTTAQRSHRPRSLRHLVFGASLRFLLSWGSLGSALDGREERLGRSSALWTASWHFLALKRSWGNPGVRMASCSQSFWHIASNCTIFTVKVVCWSTGTHTLLPL